MAKAEKAVAVQETNKGLAVVDPLAPTQEIMASDIIIPKLLLMQGLSEFVNERKAQQGDMVRSTTAEVVGGPEKPVDFIPLKMTSDWIIQEKQGQKFEYRGTIARNAGNETLPWTFYKTPTGQEVVEPTANTIEWRRMKVLNVYALLPQDIQAYQDEMKKLADTGEMPDLNKTLLPIVLSFRSTSFNAGKSVATFFAQLRDASRYNPSVKPYHYALTLECSADKNDKGSFYVFQVSGKTKKVDPKLVDEAARWYDTLSNLSSIKIDTTDEDEAAPAASTGQTRF